MSRGAARRSGVIGDDELASLFAPLEGRPLALAVSGGADSMALMHLVARWQQGRSPDTPRSPAMTDAGAGEVALGWIAAMRGDIARLPQAVVLTVDHGLRPDSAREAAFVRDAAAQLGMPSAVLRWQGAKSTTGVQEAARNARRALLLEHVAIEPAAVEAACGVRSETRVLVMAHHLEDQAETVLMRLGRGSGLDGLQGMAEDAAVVVRPDGATAIAVRIARPLLAISKQRLVATLEAWGVAWVDDPSNDDPRFERVRIRKALETLSGLGIGAEKIALSARRLADAAAWIEQSGRHMAADERGRRIQRFVQGADWHGGVYAELILPDAPVFDVPRYAAVRTLRQALASFGGEGREPELQQLETLVAVIDAGAGSLPDGQTLGGCRLAFVSRRDGGRRLHVFREGAGLHSPVVSCNPGGAVGWDGGRFTVRVGRSAPSGVLVRALGLEGWAELKRRLPDLAALGWPAAAAATLPVIEANGAIVSYPGVGAAIAAESAAGGKVRTAWAAFMSPETEPYSAEFHLRCW